jgi:hypothetical protein
VKYNYTHSTTKHDLFFFTERLKQRQGSVSSSFVTGDEIPQLEG